MAFTDWNRIADFPLMYYGLPAFLMVIGSLSLESKMGRDRLTRVAIFVGNASYAIYLSHPYCVEAARKLLPKAIPGFDATAPLGVVTIIVAATAVGSLLYEFVDQPLHKGARRLLHRLPGIPAHGMRPAGPKQSTTIATDLPAAKVPLEQDAG
jgi:peptidoglycan/LPS O-acetylase OafA/YrhL